MCWICEETLKEWEERAMSYESYEQREVNDLIEKIKEAKRELRRLEAKLALAQVELEIANG